jgi:hypothetical protein
VKRRILKRRRDGIRQHYRVGRKRRHAMAFVDNTEYIYVNESYKGTPIYPGVKVKKVMMSPDEFLETTRKEKGFFGERSQASRSQPMGHYLKRITYEPAVKDAMDRISDPKKEAWSPILFRDRGQFITHEGRNRAIAAKRLGMKEIPVFIVDEDRKTK